MATKYKRYIIPMQAPVDQISNTVKKAKFVKEIIKNFTKERTTDLTDIMDKLTKNIQLLTGGETEKHKVVFGWENPGGEQLENISNTNVQIDNNSLLSPPLGNEPAQFTTALEGVCTSP